MQQFIGCDAHRKYSIFVAMDETGRAGPAMRVEHDRLELRRFLRTLPRGTPVAVEASGGWYWLVDELEEAGLDPRLVNPLEAKQRMRGRNKTDQLDAQGLALLLRNGTLPEVWIPSAKLRDLRSLMRTRLAIVGQSVAVKNRIHAALARYGTREDHCSDLFNGKGRVHLSVAVGALPEQARIAALHEWALLDELRQHIKELEVQIQERIGCIGWVRLLKTMPGIGEILGATVYLEVGEVTRFPAASHLASYAGLVPSVHASGGRCWHGPTSKMANHYLRWAFVEAANVIVSRQKMWESKHVVQLYQRLKGAKGHNKAAVAVARHLAEATWGILTRKQAYREPVPATKSSSKNG